MPKQPETAKPRANWADILFLFLLLMLLGITLAIGFEMIRFAHHMIMDGRFGEASGILRMDFSAPSLVGVGAWFILFPLMLMIRRKTKKIQRLNAIAFWLGVLLLIMSVVQFALTTGGFKHLPI